MRRRRLRQGDVLIEATIHHDNGHTEPIVLVCRHTGVLEGWDRDIDLPPGAELRVDFRNAPDAADRLFGLMVRRDGDDDE